MKKIFALLLLSLVTACSMMDSPESNGAKRPANSAETTSPKEALKDLKLGCSAVKAVNDPEHGKVYYTAKHNLFKYVVIDKSKGDRYLCTTAEAEKAGFRPASEHFSGSVYYLVECLHSEGSGGKCHDYVGGIYKSLQIYEKVCGGNPSKTELANVVEDYAKSNKDAMDSGKYEGTTAALIHKYRCGK